jgi:hypothetical protein
MISFLGFVVRKENIVESYLSIELEFIDVTTYSDLDLRIFYAESGFDPVTTLPVLLFFYFC